MPIQKRAFAGALCGLMIAAAASAAPTTVSQKDKTFDPEQLTVPAGSSLHIVNDDTVVHNVQVAAPDGTNQNLGVQKAGDTVDFAFDKAGDFKVHCGIHPKMKLAVHVQ